MNYNKHTSVSRGATFPLDGRARRSPGTYQPTSRSASSSRSTGFGATRGTRGNAGLCSLMILLLWAALALGGVWAATNLVGGILDMPYVHESYTTRECVAVIAPDGTDLGCENKPERYHHVWVE